MLIFLFFLGYNLYFLFDPFHTNSNQALFDVLIIYYIFYVQNFITVQ